jgi:hypothetical protein
MTADEFMRLREAGAFADADDVRLSPDGTVWDRRTETPYRFVAAQIELAASLGIEAGLRMATAFEPFHAHDGAPRMVRGVACQIDVLGTRATTQSQTETHLEVTHRALAKAQAFGASFDDVSARWFTDNALIGAACDNDPSQLTATGVVLVAAAIQLEFALQGLFLRGGMAEGSLYLTDHFAYGSALVDAYALEDQVAYYPRVITSAAIEPMLDVELLPDVLNALLARDHDRRVFISYLGMLLDPARAEDRLPILEGHRDAVRSQLDATAANDRLRSKYGWVANYHDRFCSTHEPGRTELLLDDAHEVPLRPWR